MSTGDIISELNFSIPLAVKYESGNLDFPPYVTAQTLLAAKLEIERLRDALGELYAVVRGECPSLLNEDSGGDAQLDLRIQALVALTSGVSDMTKNRKSK